MYNILYQYIIHQEHDKATDFSTTQENIKVKKNIFMLF